MHNDDISQILILNKKSIQNYESQLFEAELEKFRPHQNRLLQANHKQSALLKELSTTFNTLLQDKRVRSEQSKYENVQRQRAAVTNRYKRAYQEFLDLVAGLHSAKNWYTEMKESVESLEKNVQSFVHNRRTEGAQLLDQIEKEQSANKSSQAELERERLRELMDRMTIGPQQSGSPKPQTQESHGRRGPPAPLFSPGQAARYSDAAFASQHPLPNSPPAHQLNMPSTYGNFAGQQQGYQPQSGASYGQPSAYNPSQYGVNPGPASPPPTQSSFGMSTYRGPTSPPPNQASFGQSVHGYGGYQGQTQQPPQATGRPVSQVPPGFVPPPPPPGPPPLGPQQTIHYGAQDYPVEGQGGQQQQQQEHDPWAGLSAWK